MIYSEEEITLIQLMVIAVQAFMKYIDDTAKTSSGLNVINTKFYLKVIKIVISSGFAPCVDNMITFHRNNLPIQYKFPKNKDHIGKKSKLSQFIVTV